MLSTIFRFLTVAILSTVPLTLAAGEQLPGCYFYEGREPGEWTKTTAALLIVKAPNGILLHGSVSSWKNSWIDTPNGEPTVMQQVAENRYVYQGEVDPQKPHGRCELTLHHDKKSIYINKYEKGCAELWYTGDGIGPSEMDFTYKHPSMDMCLSYLGIAAETGDKEK